MDTIKVQKRDLSIKAKQLRRMGFVPGNVFGGSLKQSVSLKIDEGTARRLIRSKREGSKLELDLEGQIIPVQIKEKMINNLNNDILQISFQALKADQKVNSVIHIVLENMDKTMGTLEKMLLEIPYASLPKDMIDTITIDVDAMPVGSVVTVRDIFQLKNEKIELQIDPEEILLRVVDKKYASGQAARQDGE